MKRIALPNLAALILALTSSGTVFSGEYQFAKILDGNTDVDGPTVGFLGGFSTPAFNDGIVAFSGIQGGSNGSDYIYTYDTHDVVPSIELRVSSDPSNGAISHVPNTGGQSFDSVSPPTVGRIPGLNSIGLAFRGRSNSGSQDGIYSWAESPAAPDGLSKVADTNTVTPTNGTYNGTTFRSQASNGFSGAAFSEGRVAFKGYDATLSAGIYHASHWSGGTQIAIADRHTAIPGDNAVGNFNGVDFVRLDGTDSVAFRGRGPSVPGGSYQEGVYKYISGQLDAVADRSTLIPGTNNVAFSDLYGPAISGDRVAFAGRGSGMAGVFSDLGGQLRMEANNTMTRPGGSDTFTFFDNVSLDGSDVSFIGLGSGGSGLYSTIGGVLKKVVAAGDVLDGKTVSNVSVSTQYQEGNQLAFFAAFSDGTSAIYLSELIADAVEAVSSGDPVQIGVLGFETSDPGSLGLDFGANTDGGDLSVNYSTTDDGTGNFGGFSVPGTRQVWDINFDGSFSEPVELTFIYDDGLLSAGTDENDLLIRHQLHDGSFEVLTPFFRDTDANVLKVLASSFSDYDVVVSNASAVPEPSTLTAILGLGAMGLIWQRRRKRRTI